MKSLKCMLNIHVFTHCHRGEKICKLCLDIYAIQEIVRNNMRTGRWVYVGKATTADLERVRKWLEE